MAIIIDFFKKLLYNICRRKGKGDIMNKKRIVCIKEKEEGSKKIEKIYYDDIKQAAAAINTKMDNWKVQLLICDAIVRRKRAFKCKWMKEA